LARSCSVCQHEDNVLINEALVVQGLSNRAMARQFGLSKDAVRRHRQHIPEMLAQASRAEEVANADSLLDRLEDLQSSTEAILSRVEGTDNYSAMLGAIREMRSNLEVIGEVTKELNRTPTLNLTLSPEWLELRALIVRAVEPFPEAREGILRALEVGGNGRA
jgi:hypothetical protein